jgi:hypothetical protein
MRNFIGKRALGRACGAERLRRFNHRRFPFVVAAKGPSCRKVSKFRLRQHAWSPAL